MPCSTWTTRSPSFRSLNPAAIAFSSFAVRRASSPACRRSPRRRGARAAPRRRRSRARARPGRGARGCPGRRAAPPRRTAPAWLRTAIRRSSRSRRSRSAADGEAQATTVARPRFRQSSSRRVSGASAPASPCAPRSRRGARRCPRARSGSARRCRARRRWRRTRGAFASAPHLVGREEVRRRRQRELLAPHRRLVLARELGVEVRERLAAPRPRRRRRRRRPSAGSRGRREAAPVEAGEQRLEPEERRPGVDGVEHLADLRGRLVHPLGGVEHRLPSRPPSPRR